MTRILFLCLLAVKVHAADFTSILDWSGRVNLTLPVAGVLETVNVQAGQVVKKDALLASLEPTLFQAGVAEARAEFDRYGQEEADAARDQDRVKELYARTVAATSELDAATLRHARVQAGMAAAQARLEKARRLLAQSELRAPFDAVILARLGEPGMVITSPCQPATVLSIARADEWLAVVTLAPAQAAGVQLGEEAEVEVAGETVKGSVRAETALAAGGVLLEIVLPRLSSSHAGLAVKVHLHN